MNSQNNIGNRIKKIRNEHDLSQIELAEMLSISQASIGHYENGKRKPPIKILIKLSKIGNVSLDWIIKGKQSTPPTTLKSNTVNDSSNEYNTSEYEKLIEILEKDKQLKKLIFKLVLDFNKSKEDLKNLNEYLYNEISKK